MAATDLTKTLESKISIVQKLLSLRDKLKHLDINVDGLDKCISKIFTDPVIANDGEGTTKDDKDHLSEGYKKPTMEEANASSVVFTPDTDNGQSDTSLPSIISVTPMPREPSYEISDDYATSCDLFIGPRPVAAFREDCAARDKARGTWQEPLQPLGDQRQTVSKEWICGVDCCQTKNEKADMEDDRASNSSCKSLDQRFYNPTKSPRPVVSSPGVETSYGNGYEYSKAGSNDGWNDKDSPIGDHKFADGYESTGNLLYLAGPHGIVVAVVQGVGNWHPESHVVAAIRGINGNLTLHVLDKTLDGTGLYAYSTENDEYNVHPNQIGKQVAGRFVGIFEGMSLMEIKAEALRLISLKWGSLYSQ